MIAAVAVKCPVAAVLHVRAGCGKESIRMCDPLCRIDDRFRLCIVIRGQTVDLLHIKDGISLHERDRPFFLAAVVLFLGPGDGVGIDNRDRPRLGGRV